MLIESDLKTSGASVATEALDGPSDPHVVFGIESDHSRIFDGLDDVDERQNIFDRSIVPREMKLDA